MPFTQPKGCEFKMIIKQFQGQFADYEKYNLHAHLFYYSLIGVPFFILITARQTRLILLRFIQRLQQQNIQTEIRIEIVYT